MLRCGVECNNDIFLRIVILKYHRDVLFQVRQYVTPFTCRIVECFFGCLLDSTIFVLSSGQVQDFWGRWWFRMSVLEPVLAGLGTCISWAKLIPAGELMKWINESAISIRAAIWNGSLCQSILVVHIGKWGSVRYSWYVLHLSNSTDALYWFLWKIIFKQRREGLRWKPSWEGIPLESELLSVGNRTLVRHILASQAEAGWEESAGKEDLVEFDSFQLCEGKSYSWIKC